MPSSENLVQGRFDIPVEAERERRILIEEAASLPRSVQRREQRGV